MSRGKTHLKKPRSRKDTTYYLDGVLAPDYMPAGEKFRALCNARVAQRRVSDRPTCEACRRKNKASGWKNFTQQMALDVLKAELGEDGLALVRAYGQAVRQEYRQTMQTMMVYGALATLETPLEKTLRETP